MLASSDLSTENFEHNLETSMLTIDFIMKGFEILISLCMDMVCVFRRKEQVDMICLIERAIVENVNCKTLKKRNDSNMNSFIPQTFLFFYELKTCL